ncbi:hypothetical protein ACSBR2_029371 [Camellia fascicularis]
METEDLIDLPPSSNSGYKSENDNLHNSECEPSDADSQPINCELKEDKLNEEISGTSEVDVGNGDSQLFMSADIDRDLIGCSSILQLNETISVAEDVKCFSSGIQSENGCVTGQDGSPISNRKRDESPISYHEISDNYISGVKKARMIVDKQQPSVHFSLTETVNGSLRSYYSGGRNGTLSIALLLMIPMKSWNLMKRRSSLHFLFGLDNPSAVSFWMDNQTRNQMSEECIALDRNNRGTIFQKSVDVTDVPSRTSDYYLSLMDKVVDEIGEEYVVQIVTDNEAAIKAVGYKLMQKRKNLYWTGCAAHCIDLMLEDIGKKKSVAKVLDCAKVITRFIYNSNWVVDFMKRFTGDRELLRPVITRFATNFITLESIVKHKTALQDMFHSQEWKHSKWSKKDDAKEVKKIIQSKDFWTKAADVLKVQEPLLKVLRLVDGDEKPTMGFIYEAMDRAKLAIKQNCRYYVVQLPWFGNLKVSNYPFCIWSETQTLSFYHEVVVGRYDRPWGSYHNVSEVGVLDAYPMTPKDPKQLADFESSIYHGWLVSNMNGSKGLKIVDASRCFNCGSYNHSLKECPKPPDNVAVNNARKQHKSRRNKNAGSRNPTRYYQNSAGGKYDGLRPGVLEAETRKLLGLGELDPPPWLNRMRQMGYPPGYLDPEVEEQEQPSGISIFTDEGNKEEKEDDGEIGKILEKVYPDLPRKMSAEFPGINAPIPENADERRWTTAGPSSTDLAKNQSHCRSNFSLEPISRDMYHRQRWSRHIRNEGPPDIDPGFSPTLSGYTSQSPQGNISVPISPSFGRTMSDGGRSPLVYEGSLTPGSHSSVPSLSQYRLFSQQNYGSATNNNDFESKSWTGFFSSVKIIRKEI